MNDLETENQLQQSALCVSWRDKPLLVRNHIDMNRGTPSVWST